LQHIVLVPKIPESLNLKEIQELRKKEKNLCKQIRLDYKKISEKVNYDFDQIKQLKSKRSTQF